MTDRICCFICRRYQPPEKLTDRRCSNHLSCQRVAARLRGRKVSKRLARLLRDGEKALQSKRGRSAA